jgi:uncharacterized protein with HEPN domain
MTAGDLKLQDYVNHMLDATRLAREYVAGISKADFLVDRRTQQAVVLSLITIGEIATRTMSEHPEFVTNNPGIPWRQMRGMRNRMEHGYFDINLEIVWDTVQTSCPNSNGN